MSSYLGHLWQVIHAFDRHEHGVQRPIEFWLNVLESQITEAREHLAAGNQEKALGEIADMNHVSFEALHRLGKHPTSFIVDRIKTAILPRVDEIYATYHKGDGHKGGGAKGCKTGDHIACPGSEKGLA